MTTRAIGTWTARRRYVVQCNCSFACTGFRDRDYSPTRHRWHRDPFNIRRDPLGRFYLISGYE